jgi:hypothetical protein
MQILGRRAHLDPAGQSLTETEDESLEIAA